MTEIWDIYDENRNKTGKTILRSEHPRGENEYHLAVHIRIHNDEGQWLISKRTPNKHFPLLWECTGGSALAGDDSLTAALRELQEETGLLLPPEKGRIVHRFRKDHYFCDVWLFEFDFQPEQIRLLENETCGAMCATADEILQLYHEGLLVPYAYMEDFKRLMQA